jgi:2-polyprenyl-3-methyl-5-hydroxy-6-metoxy-1,4-benzoquinol methylase
MAKEEKYYLKDKIRFLPYINQGPNRILDLGCAAGQLGKNLKSSNRASELVGVEIYAPAAEKAKQIYNIVVVGDVETLTLNYLDYFDYVLCGDILEHLRDPLFTLNRIYGWLKPGGELILTIPNIRSWRIILDLVLFGDWRYKEAGVLDNTHLRFFYEEIVSEVVEGDEI